MKKILFTAIACVLAGVTTVHAQQRALSSFLAARQAVAATSGTRAFLVEAGGATAGSLIGFGVIYLAASDCDSESLDCLEKAGIALLTSSVGAALGAHLAGRVADTQPSAWGAGIGALAGAAAGVGMWHLVKEDLNLTNSTGVGVLTYSVTQGILTAIGSRIGSAMR